MQDPFEQYRILADNIARDINARIAQAPQPQPVNRHPPMLITAESIIESDDNDKMKLLTNFTVTEFNHLYSIVDTALRDRCHTNAVVSPKTKFLITLTWCRFNETYKPLAMKFGLKYTYAREISIKTMRICQPILESVFVKWISVSTRLSANIQIIDYQYLLGSVDATVQKIYRPSINQRAFYSGKHKMHCMKTQALVSPTGQLMHHSHCIPGAQHDMSLFRDSGVIELIDKENQHCMNTLHAHCTVLGDSGYQGMSNEINGGVTPHKKPRNGELNDAQRAQNETINRNRIIVENWFGRHKVLWAMCSGTFRFSHKFYETAWGFCAALTNYHISIHPLRANEHLLWDDPPSDDE